MGLPSEELRVGITYDTKDDFKFISPEAEDWDAEFAVSIAVDDIGNALQDLGHEVQYIGSGLKLLNDFSRISESVDIVFNIAEGYFGRARKVQVPAILELAGIAYVGSDSYTLGLCSNKWHTKILATEYGIKTPEFTIVRDFDEIPHCKPTQFPVIAKLCYEGSSKGLFEESVTNDITHLHKWIRRLMKTYKQPILVERFIRGKEIDIPIIGTHPNRAFGVVGITLNGNDDLGDSYLTSKIVGSDGYGFKYPLMSPFVEKAEKSALRLYDILECRDFGRADARIDNEGEPYLLEINTYPFLGRHSSFTEIALKSGMGYKQMIGKILNSALQRYSETERVSRMP